MIRVAYRFRVDPERIDEFQAAWHDATEVIRATHAGARGSTLLVDAEDPTAVLLLALWESRDHWRRSRDPDRPPTASEAVMLDIGHPEGVTFYEVREDLADPPDPPDPPGQEGR